jgi:hypothetical protein
MAVEWGWPHRQSTTIELPACLLSSCEGRRECCCAPGPGPRLPGARLARPPSRSTQRPARRRPAPGGRTHLQPAVVARLPLQPVAVAHHDELELVLARRQLQLRVPHVALGPPQVHRVVAVPPAHLHRRADELDVVAVVDAVGHGDLHAGAQEARREAARLVVVAAVVGAAAGGGRRGRAAAAGGGAQHAVPRGGGACGRGKGVCVCAAGTGSARLASPTSPTLRCRGAAPGSRARVVHVACVRMPRRASGSSGRVEPCSASPQRRPGAEGGAERSIVAA